MKILVVSQYFYPENFRINDLVLELKKRGHEITVLTGKPNYPRGEYFDGYSYKGNDDEVWNDIPIYRCLLRARKQGSVNLIRNYISFVHQGRKKIKKLYKKDFDVIYVFGLSPITVALPAIKMKKEKKIPIIMNVQDLWPENIVAITSINNPIFIGIMNKLVNYIYKHCDLILCASTSFVDKIEQRMNKKVKTLFWPQYSTVSMSENCKHLLDSNKFNITFTGNIGKAQGIDLALYAADKLRDTRIHWNFVGEGRSKDEMIKLSESLNLHNHVTFWGFKKEKEIPDYLASSNAALLILKSDPIFNMTIPAKLQTYLACGIPVIGCVSGEAKEIIDEAQCGITSEQITIECLANICKQMLALDEMKLKKFSKNAIEYSQEKFDKEKLLSELIANMEGIKS